MRTINNVTLLGRVVADPEVRTSAQGTRVAVVSLATHRRWRDAKGEWQEVTAWHRVVAWNRAGAPLADRLEQHLGKGGLCYVEGCIEYRSWVDKAGAKRFATEIVAREVVVLCGLAGATPGESRATNAVVPAARPGVPSEPPVRWFAPLQGRDEDDLPF